MSEDKKRPGVGLAVFITSPDHPDCILLGIRKGSTGRGTYAVPGGHLEFGESFEECARREVLEETGLKLLNVHFDRAVNVVWPEENYHYVDILMSGEIDRQYKAEPENTEPDKCEGWEWHDWNNLPKNQFRPLEVIVSEGYNPIQKNPHNCC